MKKINLICESRLKKYFSITKKALELAKNKIDNKRKGQALDFLDMAQRYYQDALHFKEQGNYVLAFASINYAHGWLDAGARIQLFKVKNSKLFTVDD